MIGEVLGRNDPRDGGEFAGADVFAELVEGVALGHLHAAFGVAVLVREGGELAEIGIAGVRGEGPIVEAALVRGKCGVGVVGVAGSFLADGREFGLGGGELLVGGR